MNTVAQVANIVLPIIVFCFWWVILYISMHKDRSRYRNIVFLVFALSNSFAMLVSPFAIAQQIFAVLFLLMLLIVPFMFIANGVVMLRREGRSFANLLSLLFGMLLFAGELSLVILAVLPNYFDHPYTGLFFQRIPLLIMVFSSSVIYGSLVFVAFTFYILFLQLVPVRKDFDYIIILGSGLIRGDQISKLLADRLDKAIAVYQRDTTKPILIPTGGQGSDETVAEGFAMARYLEEHGIPKEHIRIEDQAVNTYQNVRFSQEIINAETGGASAYTALVTSNYHVYRALRYCRQAGLKCVGIGAHVAAYYWPSAVIREFVAVHRERKHLILFLSGWILVLIPAFLLAIV